MHRIAKPLYTVCRTVATGTAIPKYSSAETFTEVVETLHCKMTYCF